VTLPFRTSHASNELRINYFTKKSNMLKKGPLS
jgi:hypothetical protein